MSIMQFSMTVFGKQKCRKKIDFFSAELYVLSRNVRKKRNTHFYAGTDNFFKKRSSSQAYFCSTLRHILTTQSVFWYCVSLGKNVSFCGFAIVCDFICSKTKL